MAPSRTGSGRLAASLARWDISYRACGCGHEKGMKTTSKDRKFFFHAFFTDPASPSGMQSTSMIRHCVYPALAAFLLMPLCAQTEATAAADAQTASSQTGSDQSQKVDVASPAATPGDPAEAVKPAQGNFVRRFFRAYADDWKGAASS